MTPIISYHIITVRIGRSRSLLLNSSNAQRSYQTQYPCHSPGRRNVFLLHVAEVMSSPTTTDVGSPDIGAPSNGMLAWLAAILLPLMALTIMFLVGIPKYVSPLLDCRGAINSLKESIDGPGQGLLYPREEHRPPQCHRPTHSVGTCRTSTLLLLRGPAKT
jgi:hypothetical protein